MAWSIFKQGGGDGAAETWAQDLLSMIGAPTSQANVQVVYDWEKSEGGGGTYNPLNQGPTPGHSDWSGGTQYGGGASDYTSWQTGLQGAAAYLNMSNFSGIKSALVRGDSAGARAAIIASPWAASHYGGGSAFASDPLPGQATALPGGGVVQASLPGDVAGALGGGVLSGIVGAFGGDVTDVIERGALMFFGAILVVMGLLRFTGTDKLAVEAAKARISAKGGEGGAPS